MKKVIKNRPFTAVALIIALIIFSVYNCLEVVHAKQLDTPIVEGVSLQNAQITAYLSPYAELYNCWDENLGGFVSYSINDEFAVALGHHTHLNNMNYTNVVAKTGNEIAITNNIPSEKSLGVYEVYLGKDISYAGAWEGFIIRENPITKEVEHFTVKTVGSYTNVYDHHGAEVSLEKGWSGTTILINYNDKPYIYAIIDGFNTYNPYDAHYVRASSFFYYE